MVSYLRRTVLIALTAILFSSSPTRLAGVARMASPVEAVFDLEVPTGNPFPSDRFTVSDASQNTGLRVNLPKPDCAILAFDCVEIDLLNELSANYSRNGSDNLSQLTDRFGVTPIDIWDLVPSFAPESSSSMISLPGQVQDYSIGPSVANRDQPGDRNWQLPELAPC